MKQLVVGTAQFGSGYGVTNAVGRLADETIGAITGRAVERGVRLFDTASSYDDAESRLGSALATVGNVAVITKFTLPPEGMAVTPHHILGASQSKLGDVPIRGILLHRMSDLLDPRFEQALDVLRAARADGSVAKIGVSIYDSRDLAIATEVFADLDLIQIPGSVLDRRLLDSAALAALHADGVEVHVRSLFLQGLLLADPESIAARFVELVPQLLELRRIAVDAGVPLAELLVQQVRDHPVVDAVVVGATAVGELDEVLDAFDGTEREPVVFPPLAEKIVDPRLW